MRLCVTLAHPALWLDLFPAFMRSSFACLWLRITPPRWRAAHVGLLQGCPSSPVLSLCVGHLWTEFVSSQQADTGIFVDDRVLWLPAPGSSAAHDAQQALQRSDQFDRAAGLTCSRRKCHLVTDDPDCSWRGLAHRHGNTIAPTLKFLGVELSLETGGASPLKLYRLDLRKLQTRLRHATNPAFSLAVRLRIIKTLIFPALFWAAGVALPTQEELEGIRCSVSVPERHLEFRGTPGVSW